MARFERYYFEDGNAARQVAIPEEQWQVIQEERRNEAHKRRVALAKRNAAVMRRNMVYTTLMIIGAAFMCFFFVTYIRLQNDINTSIKNIGSLESQITEVKAENQAMINRINSDANLQAIKDGALSLGMVYADAGKIVYYDVEDTDYMSQYKDIP